MSVRVMRVVTRLNIGGPAIHVVLLTREMPRYGYEVSLATGVCEPHEGDMSFLVNARDPVHWIPEMSRSVWPWNDARALWRLYRLMRKERPSIVHTHTAKAGTLGRLAAVLARVPIVIHTFHGNSLNHYFSPAFNLMARSVERLLARLSDCICVISPQQATELSDQLRIAPRHKFRVIPLGLDLDPYLKFPEPCPNGGLLTVSWLGRLVPVKGIPLLLAVVEETFRRTDKIRFLIAGDGPERHKLQESVGRMGGDRLQWLGWQQDVKPVLARSHLLMQTSKNEGTPVALIQGMAAARPFVSTPAGGVVDMVGEPNAPNGILAEPDPRAFAAALVDLANDTLRLQAMGRRAREFAAQHYRKEVLLQNLASLYRELVHRTG